MAKAVIAPGARIQCRDAEWLVRNVKQTREGERLLEVVGVSPYLKEQEALFLEALEPDLKVLQPEDTELVGDGSDNYRDSLLFLEAHLRRTVPTGPELVIGHRAAMDVMDYQLVPAAKALAMPRQRLLIADAVGLGKTLECGILCSELIRRGRGRRLLVVTTKSMLGQFQNEFWNRFTIPLVRLDSLGIQRIREQLPTGQNPFHHFDKAIVSVDTLKNDRDYRTYLEHAHWDIIVIDECQNVAERGVGAQRSQRSKLAERLATRSDTLILLSATPHDGKPESFASLVNMLDPTAIANPKDYTKAEAEIRDLYVRRFRKDVIGQMRAAQGVPERDTANVEAKASAKEEAVFAALATLQLPDSDRNAKAGQLFRTTLQKAMLSSPMACLETVRNRLRTLSQATEPSSADQAALEPLLELLEPIGAAAFSKYQRLLELLRAEWQWRGQDPKDRLVIFTGRRETQRFLIEHLARDLQLPAEAVQRLDGGMVDTVQSDIVERFGQEAEPIRLLVATEVASEGLNLHYLSHRLVHFDIPWSLMTLQQRNGRIDRYGQSQQPLIRYLLTASAVEGMGDVERILQVLIRKDEQAQRNIGDPSVFMQCYDETAEEELTAAAVEAADATAFERQLEANAAPFLQSGGGLIAELSGQLLGTEGGGAATTPTQPEEPALERRDMPSLYPSLWSYVSKALGAVAERQVNREPIQFRTYDEQERLEITPPADLLRRYERLPREVRPDRLKQVVLTTRPQELQQEVERSRRRKQKGLELEYLWPLHPLVEWLVDRGLATFARHQAPVLQLSAGLDPGEVVMVLQGTIPNRSGQPVIQEWVGVRFLGTGLKVEAVEPFAQIARRLQLGERAYPNRQLPVPESLKLQRGQAVREAQAYLLQRRQEWIERMEPLLAEQSERLQRLRAKQEERLRQNFEQDGSVLSVKAEKLRQGELRVQRLFDSHQRYVEDVMTTEEAPYLKLVAVLHRPAAASEEG
ncbi:MAG: SNF2-related protein [Synechococcaceae cyanobacterium]